MEREVWAKRIRTRLDLGKRPGKIRFQTKEGSKDSNAWREKNPKNESNTKKLKELTIEAVGLL